MWKNLLNLEQNLESLSKIMTNIAKLGILVGGICVVGYSLEIEHFPQDISVGDGLLFLVIAAFFGWIYISFVAILLSLGIFIARISYFIQNLIIWMFSRFRKNPLKEENRLYEWFSLPFALLALVFTFFLGLKEPISWLLIPVISIFLYFLYSFYIFNSTKIQELLQLQIQNTIPKSSNLDDYKKNQLFSIIAIIIIPLFISIISSQVLDGAMRIVHVRMEKAIIYVKEPYALLITKSAIAENQIAPKDYTPFDKTIVLFRGFGNTTIISFKSGEATEKLEIPNDQIIVKDR